MVARRDARDRRERGEGSKPSGVCKNSCTTLHAGFCMQRIYAKRLCKSLFQSCDRRLARRAGVRRMTESAPSARLKLRCRPQGRTGGGWVFWSFFRHFFSVCFWIAPKATFICFFAFFGSFGPMFLDILKLFWVLLGHFLKNSGFLKIIVFPRKNKGFQGLGLPKIEANLTNK